MALREGDAYLAAIELFFFSKYFRESIDFFEGEKFYEGVRRSSAQTGYARASSEGPAKERPSCWIRSLSISLSFFELEKKILF